jgi:hypothetical protein
MTDRILNTNCQKNTCHNHAMCMYTPCRAPNVRTATDTNDTAKPWAAPGLAIHQRAILALERVVKGAGGMREADVIAEAIEAALADAAPKWIKPGAYIKPGKYNVIINDHGSLGYRDPSIITTTAQYIDDKWYPHLNYLSGQPVIWMMPLPAPPQEVV